MLVGVRGGCAWWCAWWYAAQVSRLVHLVDCHMLEHSGVPADCSSDPFEIPAQTGQIRHHSSTCTRGSYTTPSYITAPYAIRVESTGRQHCPNVAIEALRE